MLFKYILNNTSKNQNLKKLIIKQKTGVSMIGVLPPAQRTTQIYTQTPSNVLYRRFSDYGTRKITRWYANGYIVVERRINKYF